MCTLMSRGLSDPKEMQIIYDISKNVYDGNYTVAYALKCLKGKVKGCLLYTSPSPRDTR